MAKIEKEITYKLELNEAEYYAFLGLIGSIPYDNYRDAMNQHYSVSLNSGVDKKFRVLTGAEHDKLYHNLNEMK